MDQNTRRILPLQPAMDEIRVFNLFDNDGVAISASEFAIAMTIMGYGHYHDAHYHPIDS
jgi:hypothetical protein